MVKIAGSRNKWKGVRQAYFLYYKHGPTTPGIYIPVRILGINGYMVNISFVSPVDNTIVRRTLTHKRELDRLYEHNPTEDS